LRYGCRIRSYAETSIAVKQEVSENLIYIYQAVNNQEVVSIGSSKAERYWAASKIHRSLEPGKG